MRANEGFFIFILVVFIRMTIRSPSILPPCKSRINETFAGVLLNGLLSNFCGHSFSCRAREGSFICGCRTDLPTPTFLALSETCLTSLDTDLTSSPLLPLRPRQGCPSLCRLTYLLLSACFLLRHAAEQWLPCWQLEQRYV